MIASLYAGISGLSANATAMTVIGDNIANVGTTGFKGNRSHFANVLSTTLGGDSATGSVGRGVEFWGTNAQWTQGSMENSPNATDLAVNGKGFFMVQDGSGTNFYTRAGNFTFDKNGYLVNPDGLKLQGYQIDANGNIGTVTSVYIPGERTSAPRVTTEFNFDINLNASTAVGGTYSTAQTVYDSLGNAVPVTFTFTNTAPGAWTVTAGTGVTFDSGSGPAASMDLTFGTDGKMLTPAADVTVAVPATNGGSALSLNWDLYDAPIPPATAGISHGDVTGYAADSGTTFQYQDGYPAGTLRSISVRRAGGRHGHLLEWRDDSHVSGRPGGFSLLRRPE